MPEDESLVLAGIDVMPDIDPAAGESLIPGEEAILARYVTIFARHFRKNYEGRGGVARRAIHAKSHACLRASFEVFEMSDGSLRHGVFARPATYDALVRVSNGDGPPGPDTDKIASMGFAIKVRGVTAEKLLPEQAEDSQDFLFLNQPAYISKDVRGYESLMTAIDGGFLARAYAAVRNLPGILYRLKASPKDDPLNTFYWGVAPFRLGDVVVKYLIRPAPPLPFDRERTRRIASPDYLKDLLRRHIESDDVAYEFYLQKRLRDGTEDRTMPVEDYSVAWDESRSVPVRVGTLRIPRQSVDDGLDREAEAMVFSPWNTTKDFRPLGSLNRARKVVYAVSSRLRHTLNRSVNSLA